VGLLVLLKTFQRLGYFLLIAQVPHQILRHIATAGGLPTLPAGLDAYDATVIRKRQMPLIRKFLGVTAYGPAARRVMVKAAVEAARTKENLADIVNVVLEELIRQRYELPAFSALTRVAAAARHTVNRGYQQLIAARLDRATRVRIDALFARTPGVSRSAWDTVKREPKRPTTRQMKEVLEQLHWLQALDVSSAVFSEMPTNKLQQFAAEAKTLDASDMHLLTPHKRYALAAILIQGQAAKALDDLAEMFVRRVQNLHQKGQQALAQYRNDQSAQTDTLIALFSDVVTAYMEDGTKEERFDAIAVILGEHPQELLDRCEEHRTYAGNTYVPFLPRFYRSPRSVLLRFLESVPCARPVKTEPWRKRLLSSWSIVISRDRDLTGFVGSICHGSPINGGASSRGKGSRRD
jgi:hypothetical protein